MNGEFDSAGRADFVMSYASMGANAILNVPERDDGMPAGPDAELILVGSTGNERRFMKMFGCPRGVPPRVSIDG